MRNAANHCIKGLVNAGYGRNMMRSRYSAYVLRLSDYVLSTWHTSTRPQDLDLSGDSATKWLDLTVVRAIVDGDLPMGHGSNLSPNIKSVGRAHSGCMKPVGLCMRWDAGFMCGWRVRRMRFSLNGCALSAQIADGAHSS